MTREIVTAVRLVIASVIVCCVFYTLVILAFAAVAAPQKRLGSLVEGKDGAPVGSRLVAQAFTRPEYFWPRPSACGFDASAAAGSNLAPTNPLLRERAEKVITRLDLSEGVEVPADLVAASGSGLDPHISFAGALIQIPRIANSRGMGENELRHFVEQHAELNAPAVVGGEPLINVLLLNLALDEAHPVP
jgi:K+-transporting ATPase ATPase C chain